MNQGIEISMGPDELRVIPIIVTTLKRAGTGIPADPHRIITQIWSEQGNLLHEIDPFLTQLLIMIKNDYDHEWPGEDATQKIYREGVHAQLIAFTTKAS